MKKNIQTKLLLFYTKIYTENDSGYFLFSTIRKKKREDVEMPECQPWKKKIAILQFVKMAPQRPEMSGNSNFQNTLITNQIHIYS